MGDIWIDGVGVERLKDDKNVEIGGYWWWKGFVFIGIVYWL